MAIPQGYNANFKTLLRAAAAHHLCLMECYDKKTGKMVIAICAVGQLHGQYHFFPLAKMFDGSPYDELRPPMEATVEKGPTHPGSPTQH
jgi:hypothetical protein